MAARTITLKKAAVLSGLAVAALALAGCAGSTSNKSAGAPEPLKRIDPARFYSGTWLEIARRPMFITDGCVAGTTSYRRRSATSVSVLDACREGGRSGREKSIGGEGTILDPGRNTKLRVIYNAFISRDYWILDRADDYSWFIEASPDFRDAYIFTRKVPSDSLLRRLVGRLQRMGYDVSKLEFPAQPPVGRVTPAR
ncbi:MAG: lipocalin family protein [Beijerinckiaceae bacterium]